ncbi:MAG: hypothetical protein NT011_08615 [Kiritimatiellaeota bacterium]|nr:hypothetical protein [Kiritimatiellota bacterium]
MKKWFGTAGLMILLCTGLTASAYDTALYDDIGVAYGLTRADILIQDNEVYMVDAYIYGIYDTSDCFFAGNGLLFYYRPLNSLKLIIFESIYLYDYSMEGYYYSGATPEVYWCNAKGRYGATYLHFVSNLYRGE